MLGNASRSVEDLTDISILEERLSQSRAEAEFTMQVVCNETGVPADTLRSWERRHGFPDPIRTDSNRRRYSQRDIIAVQWLREQTERGQGISDAVAMLRRVMQSASEPVHISPATTVPETARRPVLTPVQTLTDALLNGNLAAAQTAWDQLSVATSPDALCSEVLIPSHTRLQEEELDETVRWRSTDFLRRKALVLFDHSVPDRGSHDVVLLTSDSETASIPAFALGTILARSDFRIALPMLDARDTRAVMNLASIDRSTAVVFVSPASESGMMKGFQALLPEARLFQWWPDPDTTSAGDGWLPAPLLSVPDALINRM